MYTAYLQYVAECERSNMEPLEYAEWLELDAMLD